MIDENESRILHWILRIAVVCEFYGHGAFGFITKAGWVPYFRVVGLDETWAYRLMPVIGTFDWTLGTIALLSPRRFGLAYMAFWGAWTAIVRPLSGEPIWETVERAYNYGVPLAFLLLSGWPRTARDWFSRIEIEPPSTVVINRVMVILRAVCGLMLVGHGAFEALVHKKVLVDQYAIVGLPPLGLQGLGWFEIVLGLVLLVRPQPSLLFFTMAWKIATELLYPISGTPMWEFIERAGSFAAPLALACLILWQRADAPARRVLAMRAPSASGG